MTYTYLLLVLLIGSVVAKPLTNENSDPREMQSKAGITDTLNPANLPGLNLINNTLPSLNQNFLKDVKLFFLTVQGAVMPGNVFTGNLKNILQGLGSFSGSKTS